MEKIRRFVAQWLQQHPVAAAAIKDCSDLDLILGEILADMAYDYGPIAGHAFPMFRLAILRWRKEHA